MNLTQLYKSLHHGTIAQATNALAIIMVLENSYDNS